MGDVGPVLPRDVADAGGFRHEDVYVRGVRLHVAQAGDPGDPLIVLLHDWPGLWADMRWLLEPLAGLGFHVVALDARGCGLSDKPPSGYDVMHAAGDVVAVARALGHDELAVVGAGSGGCVGWGCAARYPSRVRAVVSVCGVWPGVVSRVSLSRPWLVVPVAWSWLCARFPRVAAWAIGRWPRPWAERITVRAASAGVGGVAAQRVAEVARVRARHARVARVASKLVRWARVPYGVVPARWAQPSPSVPVLVVTDGSALWRAVVARVARRVPGCASRVVVSGSRLPYVEDPAGMASVVAQWVGPRLRGF